MNNPLFRRPQGLIWLLLLLSAPAAETQQPELAHRPDVAKRPPVPAPPAPMKAPAVLEPARAANGIAIYQALRQRTANGDAFTVSHLVLNRDAACITLETGAVYFYGPVGGTVTGAVFLGEGLLHIEPPSAMERHQLKIVMKTEVLDQHFSSAVFAFTDATAAELRKGSSGPAAGSGIALAQAGDTQTLLRRNLNLISKPVCSKTRRKPQQAVFSLR